MSSEKPNFLAQPVVKNVFMFRNGDPYYEARRIVINQKRVCNFETLLREVTGGIQAPFGAVRNIYTPREGHKVDCLESLQSGEQYVAAGREKFKKLDYQQIGSRRKRMTLPVQAKPPPLNRIVVSARFLKPIKEPCTIFVVANGDILDPAVRLLIQQRMLGQFDKILEMITEKMGLKVLGGVRSLYTYEGHQVTNGSQLESGQLYVAVGRERFKKLPYSDLLFTKPRGTRRINGMKAYSLPPIYRFSKQNGNSKSMVRSSDSGEGESKASAQRHNGCNKEHLSSIVREISQARLISLRKKRSGQSMTLGIADNDDLESKADDRNTEDKAPQDQSVEEKPSDNDVNTTDGDAEKGEEKVETAADASAAVENTTEEDTSASKDENEEPKVEAEEEKKEDKKPNGEKEGEEETEERNKPSDDKEIEEETKKLDNQNGESRGKATEEPVEKVEEVADEEKEFTDESKEEVKSEVEQSGSSSNRDKTQDSQEKENGSHSSSEDKKDEQQENTEEEKQDKDSGEGEKSNKKQANDVDTREEQQEKESSSDPEKTRSDNETKESDSGPRSGSNSNQEEDENKTEGDAKEPEEEERKVNGKVSGEDDEVESEAELDLEEQNSASSKDAAADGEKGQEEAKDDQDENKERKERLGKKEIESQSKETI